MHVRHPSKLCKEKKYSDNLITSKIRFILSLLLHNSTPKEISFRVNQHLVDEQPSRLHDFMDAVPFNRRIAKLRDVWTIC